MASQEPHGRRRRGMTHDHVPTLPQTITALTARGDATTARLLRQCTRPTGRHANVSCPLVGVGPQNGWYCVRVVVVSRGAVPFQGRKWHGSTQQDVNVTHIKYVPNIVRAATHTYTLTRELDHIHPQLYSSPTTTPLGREMVLQLHPLYQRSHHHTK